MGSEMCIRDRSRAVANFLPATYALLLEDLNELDAVSFRIRSYRSCLLYTSDAADERSSVDLGGRRIIKKQHKTTDERATNVRENRIK